MMRRLALSIALLVACGEPSVDVPDLDGGSPIDTGASACLPPQSMCGSQCVNTANDSNHCGTCFNACSGGTFCSGSQCVRTCSPPLMGCGDQCVDLASDPLNCGSCGRMCETGQACRGGDCACGDNQISCSGSCVDSDNDPANCGQCGRMCRADQMCVAGSCTCPDSEINCNDTCIDATSDRNNCGMCNRSCNADEVCNMSNCECAGGDRETDCNDGFDDDCDMLIDCADPDCEGVTRSCDGACGPNTGQETCLSTGSWGACEGGSGGVEICGDGIDQDCDGSDLRAPDSWETGGNDSCAVCPLISPDNDPDLTIQSGFDSVDDVVDCFRFMGFDNSGITQEFIQVTLQGIAPGHDYDIWLYRNFDDCVNRMPLAFSTNTGNADESIAWGETLGTDDTSTYYIRVTRFAGMPTCTETYSLSVNGLN